MRRGVNGVLIAGIKDKEVSIRRNTNGSAADYITVVGSSEGADLQGLGQSIPDDAFSDFSLN